MYTAYLTCYILQTALLIYFDPNTADGFLTVNSLVVFVYRLVLHQYTKTAKCYVKQNNLARMNF